MFSTFRAPRRNLNLELRRDADYREGVALPFVLESHDTRVELNRPRSIVNRQYYVVELRGHWDYLDPGMYRFVPRQSCGRLPFYAEKAPLVFRLPQVPGSARDCLGICRRRSDQDPRPSVASADLRL